MAHTFPESGPFYVHCKSGGRSTIACSILKKAGFTGQINVLGGYDQMRKENTNLKFKE